ncbi:YfhO family protein [Hyalangium minutum]|uniref:YfhO family protein n=1 Tax=Hyalangium minutum TaxID=394096 RepID=A0A085WX90_9BACT|nr:YfhO family protein [Hyalangium minutum]KFE72303.1 hypothetical protein DB31_0565 [Hyalangium minutum]
MKRSTRNAITVCGFLAILALIYRSVFTGHLLAGRDVFRIFFPDSAFLLESLHAGELPLWNPYMRLGQPFAATLYSQVFYPPRWAAVLLTGSIASMTAMQVFHAAVAAVGVFLLARQLRLSWGASLVAGAVFGVSPMMTDLGIQQNVVNAAAWSGFILSAARTTAVKPGPGPIARLAVFATLSLLAGSPETTLWQGIVSLLAVWGTRGRGVKAPQGVAQAPLWKAVARVAGGMAMAAGLSALVLLPAAEFAANSLRTNAASFAEQRLAWSVSWPQLLAMVWPLADWPRGPYWGEDQWFILNQFLGSVAVALAVVGAIAGPRRARPFAVGAVLFALLSLGRHFPPAAMVLHLPPFSLFRYPAKYFVGAAFCISLLSGFGLEAMGRLSRHVRPSLLRAVLAFIGMGVAIGVAGPIVKRLPMRESAEAGVTWPLLFLGLATAFLFVLRDSYARPSRVRHALAALAVLELVAAHHLLTVPKYSPYEPLARTSLIRQKLPDLLEGRISADIEGPADPTKVPAAVSRTIEQSRDRLIPNRFVEERLPALEGYGAPELARSDVFHLAGERSVYDLTGVTWYVRQGPPPYEDLELLQTLEDGTTLSRSKTALPRAFLVQKAQVVPDEEALKAVTDSAEPFRHTVFLATGEPLDRPECGGQTRIVDSGAQRLELEVVACDESYLVVSDSHYPGWRATLDGASVPLHRANYALRAVRLPAGTHKVRFEYAPLSFRAGVALSLLSLSGLMAALFLARRRTGS